MTSFRRLLDWKDPSPGRASARFITRESGAVRVRPGSRSGREDYSSRRPARRADSERFFGPRPVRFSTWWRPSPPAAVPSSGDVVLPTAPSACCGPRAVRPGRVPRPIPAAPLRPWPWAPPPPGCPAQLRSEPSATPPPLVVNSQPLPRPILISLGTEERREIRPRPHVSGTFRPRPFGPSRRLPTPGRYPPPPGSPPSSPLVTTRTAGNLRGFRRRL